VADCIDISSSQWDRKKLWNLWLRTISNYDRPAIAILFDRFQISNLDRPQKSWIFQETSEVKLTTNIMALRDPRLWLQAKPQARIYYKEDKYSIKTIRLWLRERRQ